MISVLISTVREHDKLKRLLDSLPPAMDDCGHTYEIILCNAGDPMGLDWIWSYFGRGETRALVLDRKIPYIDACNEMARHAGGDFLLLLDDDVELYPRQVKHMLRTQMQYGVPIVGQRLFFPDGTVQHDGVAFGDNWIPGHVGWKQKPIDQQDDLVPAVTFACVLIDSDLYFMLDGLDKALTEGVDPDFCLRAGLKGYSTAICRQGSAIHHESSTTGPRDTRGGITPFVLRWGKLTCEFKLTHPSQLESILFSLREVRPSLASKVTVRLGDRVWKIRRTGNQVQAVD